MDNIMKMTKKDFKKIKFRKWNEDIGKFDSLIIIPTRRKHDSGYMSMEFIACKDGKPLYRLGGYSDVIHFDGIGGFGLNWASIYKKVPDLIAPKDWNIDCLPSGYLRLFSSKYYFTAGSDTSSFEIFADKIRQRLKK